MKLSDSLGGVNGRRLRAMHRLEKQLKSGVKPSKDGVIPLTETDIKRIQKEIKILSERVKKLA
jgi:hypothetical protein